MATVTITVTDLDPPDERGDAKVKVNVLFAPPGVADEEATPAQALAIRMLETAHAKDADGGDPPDADGPVQLVLDGLIGGYEELDDAGRAELLDLAEAWADGERRAEVAE